MIERIKYLYRAFRYRYKIDPTEIQFINEQLLPGQIAVDIGCHKGAYLYWLKKNVGPQGKVFAFEPQPKLFSYLQKIQKIFSFKNVILENKGLSTKSGHVSFHVPSTKNGTSPGARIDRIQEDISFDAFNIEVVSLDEYFFDKNIFPHFIKIDVEGHEESVLKGGLQLLKKCHPTLLMECENRHLNQGDVFDIFTILFNLGYQGFYLNEGKLEDLSTFRVEQHQKIKEGPYWSKKDYINNFIFKYK